MRIRNKLVGFSIALLLFPTALIGILLRILYYQIQWEGTPPPIDQHNRLWEIVVANYGFLIVLALAIAVVLLLATGIAFLRGVLQPLDELRRAAKEIEAGNLDVSLRYTGQDEFLPVFEQFDAMRAHLKDLLWKRVEDEQSRIEMIASIAHDFKTPVTAIQGYAQGLLDGIANTPEKEERYLRTIVMKSGELSHMAQGLYDLSSLEVRTMPFMMQTLPFLGMIKEILVDAQEQDSRMKLHASLDVPEDAMVYIDPMQFQRVVTNVLQNSVKYRREDLVQVEVSGRLDGRRVLLSFSDDGIGASAADCERMFERFYRSDSARSSAQGGSGLGLSIAHHIIEGMGGRIWARPNAEKGLCVHISIPLVLSSENGDCMGVNAEDEKGCSNGSGIDN